MQITLGDIHISKNCDSNPSQPRVSLKDRMGSLSTDRGKSHLVSSGRFQTLQVICLTLKFSMPCICDMNHCSSCHFKTFIGIIYITFFILKLTAPLSTSASIEKGSQRTSLKCLNIVQTWNMVRCALLFSESKVPIFFNSQNFSTQKQIIFIFLWVDQGWKTSILLFNHINQDQIITSKNVTQNVGKFRIPLVKKKKKRLIGNSMNQNSSSCVSKPTSLCAGRSVQDCNTDQLLLLPSHFRWPYLIIAKCVLLHSCSDNVSVPDQALIALGDQKRCWLKYQPTRSMLLPPGFK